MAEEARDAVWIDVLPAMNGFAPELAKQLGEELDKTPGEEPGERLGGKVGAGIVAGVGANAAGKMSDDDLREIETALAGFTHLHPVAGGATRQASVRAGLEALAPHRPSIVLVHDAARALTPADVFDRVVTEVATTGHGVIPVLPVSDTIKRVDAGAVVEERRDADDGLVERLAIADHAAEQQLLTLAVVVLPRHFRPVPPLRPQPSDSVNTTLTR